MPSFNIYNHASQSQINRFGPTYLYIKRHSETGLQYFGMTKKNPIVYGGSGTYWRDHIRKHGKNKVETIWFCLFTDIETLVEMALILSDIMDVASSGEWANLVPETGTGGTVSTESYMRWWNSLSPDQQIKVNLSKRNFGSSNGMYGTCRTGPQNPMFGKTQSDHCKTRVKESNTGKRTVIKDGKTMRISISDFDPNTMVSVNKDKIVVRDSFGNAHQVSVDDPRYISGDFLHVNTGKIRSDLEKKRLSEFVSSTKWYNNGEKSIRSSSHPGDGWIAGRIGWKR